MGRLLGGRLEPLEVATRLARALEDNQRRGQAPTAFYLHLHPTDLAQLKSNSADLEAELAGYVVTLAEQTELTLAGPPQISIVTDETQARGQVRFEAITVSAPEADEATQIHAPFTAESDPAAAVRQLDAFLIVNGRRHINLTQPTITIGRRTDNDIVLDSPAVSRRHAQLRWRYGRFVLYDVSGRGNTAVNGRAVRECVLQPGDVIRLSDELLIYGEGEEGGKRPSLPRDDDDDTTLIHPLWDGDSS